MSEKDSKNKIYYIPDRLSARLRRIFDYPITVVQAPSGFGKTTSVREFLKRETGDDDRILWYTSFAEPPSKTWTSICDIIAKIDSDCGERLLAVGVPSGEQMDAVREIAAGIRCDRRTFLVVDNFQDIVSDHLEDYIAAFATHGSEKLRIVVITQQLDAVNYAVVDNINVTKVDSEAFFFDREDVRSYFAIAGYDLGDDELDYLHSRTEGWISAIRLQLAHYARTGRFDTSVSMNGLIETAIWDTLDQNDQNFLLNLSVFDRFTARQAAAMAGEGVLPRKFSILLDDIPFIRYYPGEGVYTIHGILREYLLYRFARMGDDETRREVYRRAGRASEIEGDYYFAALFHEKTGNYDEVLRLELKKQDLTEVISLGKGDFIVRILRDCPREVLFAHPRSVLVITFELILMGLYEEAGKALRLLEKMAEDPGSFPEAEDYRSFLGELALIRSFTEYNDIERMAAFHAEAAGHLGGEKSPLIDPDAPWTFGIPSVMSMFWREPGKLRDEIRLLTECLPAYGSITAGHGTAADIVMKAEALLMEGDADSASALCHKALYLADRRRRDVSICIAAELVLARTAILRGDAGEYGEILKNIRMRTARDPKHWIITSAELAARFLACVTEDPVTLSINDIDSYEAKLYAAAIPYGQLVYAWELLKNGMHSHLSGLAGLFLERAEKSGYLYERLYQLIFQAVSKLESGMDDSANGYLIRALELALPDRVYLPFAEQPALLPLLEGMDGRPGIGEILTLLERHINGLHAIRHDKSDRPKLSPREREVALLARQGRTTKEIAAMLFVSGETVKMTLKKIFAKLDIKSRAQLRDKDF